MPIEQIVAEKAANGEIDPELAMSVSGKNAYAGSQHRREQPQRSGKQKTTLETDYGTVQISRRDVELMVDIGILLMLILIWSRV